MQPDNQTDTTKKKDSKILRERETTETDNAMSGRWIKRAGGSLKPNPAFANLLVMLITL